MKPAFALDFRDDTVSLLHRSGGGWKLIGATPIGAPDMSEALNYLRSTALGLSPKGITTKLIIPNDQILYTWVHAPASTAEERHAQVIKALEGRTPYAVSDLAFDYSGDGPDLLVAVIAKETLGEAEAFASEYRFNPVSFVAVPDTADFAGEPWFGPTANAPTLLGSKKLERDTEAVSLKGQPNDGAVAPLDPDASRPEVSVSAPAEDPAPTAPKIEAPQAKTAEPDPAEPELASEPEPSELEPSVPEPSEPEPSEPEQQPDTAHKPEAGKIESGKPDAEIAEPASRPEPAAKVEAPAPKAEIGDAAQPVPISVDEADDRDLIARLGDTLSKPIQQPERPAPAAKVQTTPPIADIDEAPMALDVPSDDPPDDEPQGADAIRAALSAKSARVTDVKIEDDVPDAPSAAALAAFNTRRQDGAPHLSGKPSANAAPALGAAKPNVARPLAPVAGGKPAKNSALRGMGALVSSATTPKRQKVEMPKASVSAAATLDVPATSNPAAPARRPLAKGPGGFALREPVRGKPRYLGLILTVVLLFLLAMIAAWSSYSLGAWNMDGSAPVQSASVDTPSAPAASADTPDPADEMLADGQDPEALADGQASAAATADAVQAPQDPVDLTADIATADPALQETPVQPDPAAAEVTVAAPALEPKANAPKTQAAEATIAQGVTASTDGTQDEIFLASMDAPPSAPDPLSLPLPEARGDPLPAAQPAPPPFGTVYQFEANGTIRPTPEGIITPEGVLLRAGKPPRVPAERPAAIAAEAAALAPAALAQPAPDAVTDAPAAVFADPALAGKLPKPRPASLVPPADAQQGSLAPEQGSRVASLRPQPRPNTVLAAGEAARLASSAATLSAAPAASNTATSGSPLAIAISRKPEARPRDMSRAVEAAIAVAMKQPAPAPIAEPDPAPKAVAKAAIAVAPTAPEADGEPDTVASNRKTPLRTTVAKQATFKNAINLSKMNLIGVYGTQSNRYALVRQANGRYKKVRVGDSIDGGRVAAITASEVRYQKGSRLISLAMPSG